MSYHIPSSEPVAVVGSSCRFAGGVSSPSKLWALLERPVDLTREVPANRFSIKGFFHEDGEHHGTTNSPKGYWLEGDHRAFDTSFFNITPKEAEAIDPQQRMLLEAVYESLESAGYTIQQYSGQKVAVFAGIMTADYDTLSQRDDITASQYYATGNARSIISNRLSYFYNFQGPSMTIDTACSSSLVALHQAVLSLRSGESVMACVAGANLMLTPEQFIVESSLHMLSPSGRCRMWDAGADGYARGEGVAALLIKPLSRALADGDNIQAIIRETGVNSDGRTKGITMPNPQAQAALIRDTYSRTGLDPRSQDHRPQYFEAHGTGTHAGDPREAAAIAEAFFGSQEEQEQQQEEARHLQTADADTPDDQQQPLKKLLVGSVKTVIGHTEGAAGLAGVLKVIQAMRHGQVPPNLHLENLNPSVKPFYANLQIPTAVMPWPAPRPGHPQRASVNSFGFGGTNSHAIVECYTPEIHDSVGLHFAPAGSVRFPRQPIPIQAASVASENSTIEAAGSSNSHGIKIPLLLSANSQKSLLALASEFRDFLSTQRDGGHPAAFEQALHHLYADRAVFPFRLAIPGGSQEDILRTLDTVLRRATTSPGAAVELGTRAGPTKDKLKILGVFTGQGAQWATMAKGLLMTCPTFQQSITALDKQLQACIDPPDWTLAQEILAEGASSRVNIAAIAQPLSTAIQLALVDLLTAIGVSFHTVVGHSSGEIAAAYAAGRLTARDAVLIAYFRGRYANLARGAAGAKGGMIAVGLSRAEAEKLCEGTDGLRGRVVLAASNSPTSTTISGDLDAVGEVHRLLAEKGTFARPLVIDTGYHSHHMLPAADEYRKALLASGIKPLSPGEGAARWCSSVYGDSSRAADVVGDEELAGEYWIANMCRPVLFREALEEALYNAGNGSDSFDVALEVGPHPQLKGPATQTIKSVVGDKNVPPYSGLLGRKKNDAVAFSEFLGFMWTHFGSSAVRLGGTNRASHPPKTTASGGDAPESLLELMPRYAWDHSQVHYRESRVSRQYHFRTHAPHELLGVRTRDDTEYELRWRNILKTESIPWVEHHRFQGQALLPASAYCVMALDAARVYLNGRAASVVELEEVEFLSGITIEPGSYGIEVLFALSVSPPQKEKHQQQQQQRRQSSTSPIEAVFTVTSAYADGSTPMRKNFQGSMRIVLGEPAAECLPARPPSHAETMTVGAEAFYHMMSGLDLDYTGPFRGIRTIERRLDFASTTLLKNHPEDTTGLSLSPAVLDTCFQSCFSAFSSAGDRALWTSFLPRSVAKMRFNLAVLSDDKKESEQTTTAETTIVDAYLTDFKPMSKEGAATITGDLAIYNEAGEMEVQVEGMTIASFAATKPEDDYELYLHTVMRVDPEDEIVGMEAEEEAAVQRSLLESCERVAAFYKQTQQPMGSVSPLSPTTTLFPFSGAGSTMAPMASLSPSAATKILSAWPDETEESLRDFIASSPHSGPLGFLSTLGKNLPDVLPAMLPAVIYEARTQHRFQTHLAAIVRQVAHRYPRMNVLGVTDPEMVLDEHIVAGLGTSFGSFTIVAASSATDESNGDAKAKTTKKKMGWERRVSLTERQREKIGVVKRSDLRLDDDGGDAPQSQAPAQSQTQSQSSLSLTNFDLVVLSTSALGSGGSFNSNSSSPTAMLKRVRSLMKPGAFLVLIHVSASPLRERLRRCAAAAAPSSSYPPPESAFPPTPPDWPDILEECGFVRGPRNADQYYPPGFAVTVRQTGCPQKAAIRRPLLLLDAFTVSVRDQDHSLSEDAITQQGQDLGMSLSPLSDNGILIVGGGICARTAAMATEIQTQLDALATAKKCARADFIETAAPEAIASCTAAIILTDLDQPTLSTMTAERLEALRALLRPDMVVLWVTHRARDQNPEHAASFGFARTLLAEIPSLTLQMLDLDDIFGSPDASSRLISESFARLLLRESGSAGAGAQETLIKDGALLWSHEPEIHIDASGRRLVPRVLPYRPGIDRVNAARRIVSRPVNTVETCVEIVPTQSSTDGSTHYSTRLNDVVVGPSSNIINIIPGQTTIQVHYSSVDVLNLGCCYDDDDDHPSITTSASSSHVVVVGRDVATGRPVVALSQTNGSFVQVPSLLVHELASSTSAPDADAALLADSAAFASWLLRYLAALSILERSNNNTRARVLLIEPDEGLYECASEVFASRSHSYLTTSPTMHHHGESASVQVSACTTHLATAKRHPDWTFVHPCSAPRTLKALFGGFSSGGGKSGKNDVHVPAAAVSVFDFLSSDDESYSPEISELILDCLPHDTEYHSAFSLLSSAGQALPAAAGGEVDGSGLLGALLAKAVERAAAKVLTSLHDDVGGGVAGGAGAAAARGVVSPPASPTASPSRVVAAPAEGASSKSSPSPSSVSGVVTVPALLQVSRPSNAHFQILSWRAERTIPHTISPSAGGANTTTTNLLRPYKTYVLIGITRDLGQSLTRLFVSQGARHVVLASRNPPAETDLLWKAELEAATPGLEVRVERLDVTDLADVRRFKRRLEEEECGMPPVGGVVNGAMVLEDKVWAQMELETLHRVLRPKTVGSWNLDRVFGCYGADDEEEESREEGGDGEGEKVVVGDHHDELEFFIMTSSFAAVGGHAGQANYAAANMYMNGLAASRRRRGLAASVLNIGVIYGLGFLHREKDNLYIGLEREGYPPVSERDVHHMFLEAISAGRAPLSNYSDSSNGDSHSVPHILDLTTGLSRYRVSDKHQLHWHRDPRFSHYTLDATNGDSDDGGDDGGKKGGGASSNGAREKLARAITEGDVVAVVTEEVAGKLQALLQLQSAVPLDASVSDLGVDSLMAVEIRAWIYKTFGGRDVPVMKILGASSIAKLCADIANLIIADRAAAAKAESEAGTTTSSVDEAAKKKRTGDTASVVPTAVAKVGSHPHGHLPGSLLSPAPGSATSDEAADVSGGGTSTATTTEAGTPMPSRPSTMESERGVVTGN